MQMTQLIKNMGRNDAKLIVRDRFMLGMFGFVAYIGVALRYLLPWANTYLAEHGVLPNATFAYSLDQLYAPILAYLSIYDTPLLVGMIFGFVFLEEKDDHTLMAMRVTPVPLPQYAMFRIAVPTALAFVLTLVQMLFIKQSLPALGQLVAICLVASLLAPIASLFFATFAENKVQGFAVAKFTGIAGWTILGAWFVSGATQWLFGLFPPFLVSKAYFMALGGDGRWWVALAAGLVGHLLVIKLLLASFSKMATR